MKKLLATLILFFLHSIATANEDAVIRLSEAVEVGNVVVKPSKEYVVDFGGYEVPREANLLIFHVLDSPRSNYYYQEIKHGKTLYKMNSNTLKATTDSPPFRGLNNSNGAFLIIGSEVEPGSINTGILYSNQSIAIIVRD